MVSGFFAGGLADSLQQQQQDKIKQQYLGLAQQSMQNEQQRFQQTQAMKLYGDGVQHIQDFFEQYKIAHPDGDIKQAVSAMRPTIDNLKSLAKNLDPKLPDLLEGQVAAMIAAPSRAVTEGALARAKEGPQKRELIESEIGEHKAKTAALEGKTEQTKELPVRIVEGIKKGDIPPVLTGFYSQKAGIMSEAEKQGVNLSQMQLEWTAALQQVKGLNSQRMIQYNSLAKSTLSTIDEVIKLSEEMRLSGVPALNKLELDAYKQTQGNTPNGQLVAKYLNAVAELKGEFAQLNNAGYAPTESAWKLSDEQVNSNFGWKQLASSISESRRIIGFRVSAIRDINPFGPGGANRYVPGKSGQAPPEGGMVGPGETIIGGGVQDLSDADLKKMLGIK